MGKIETYSSLEEKGKAFDQKIINTRNELDQCLDEYENNKSGTIFFRGCNEAKYKLYNKAQRVWITEDRSNHYNSNYDFIQNLINIARDYQDGLLSKYYSAFGLPINDLLILGFLQHYGAPTTFLDWTYSFENSLFFAIDASMYKESANEIDNYISIYVVDNQGCHFQNYIDKIINLAINMSNEGLEHPNENELYSYMLNFFQELDYQSLKVEPISLIPGYNENVITHEIKEYGFNFMYNQQSLRIINQKGLFIFNPSENQPLEYFCQANYNFENNELILPRNKIKCLDIHKSLKKDINSILAKQNPRITKKYIYPKEEEIAKQAYQQFQNFDSIKK